MALALGGVAAFAFLGFWPLGPLGTESQRNKREGTEDSGSYHPRERLAALLRCQPLSGNHAKDGKNGKSDRDGQSHGYSPSCLDPIPGPKRPQLRNN
jgi:hypothetical protein